MFHPFLVCAKIIVLRLTPETNKKKRLAFEPLVIFHLHRIDFNYTAN